MVNMFNIRKNNEIEINVNNFVVSLTNISLDTHELNVKILFKPDSTNPDVVIYDDNNNNIINTKEKIPSYFVKQSEIKIENFFLVGPEMKEASEKIGLDVEFIPEINKYKVSTPKKMIKEMLKHFK
ncbi:21074_t:CDS:2 [Cetraspora pellucida]|uniref:21074_t:CDS:1 n=1 Tax=Cetraspora pellucida TaxID=1433469 RepID=A0A9N9N2J6_9GLOM|nr:21074_t:CDS:2 [Cetraspora pellucida]